MDAWYLLDKEQHYFVALCLIIGHPQNTVVRLLYWKPHKPTGREMIIQSFSFGKEMIIWFRLCSLQPVPNRNSAHGKRNSPFARD